MGKAEPRSPISAPTRASSNPLSLLDHRADAAEQAARRGALDDRKVLNGIYWRLRTGSPWAEIPSATDHRRPATTLQPFVRWALTVPRIRVQQHGANGKKRGVRRNGVRHSGPRWSPCCMGPREAD